MAGKYFLVDTTKCTACRGCQVACKQWNKLPATETRNWGSHQNPKDLSFETYRLVRFNEYPAAKNSMVWYFFTDACRHCVSPPCKDEGDRYAKDAIVVDENGAVIYTDKTKGFGAKFEDVRKACPYDIPRLDPKSGQVGKCHMCYMRVNEGLLPACAKSCPTGALMFGDEAEIKKLGEERLALAKQKFGDKAQILDPDDVRVLYLIVDDKKKYSEYA
jgi:formate dehydrogenase iron-sulfur subunit